MIRINKNTSNNVVFTLNESTTINNPNYLLELVSKQDLNSKVLRLSGDITTNIVRYNEFIITEASTDDLDNAIINLIEGTYTYFAYETSGSTLSLSGASIIESGLCKVIGDISGGTTTIATYTNSNQNYIFQ